MKSKKYIFITAFALIFAAMLPLVFKAFNIFGERRDDYAEVTQMPENTQTPEITPEVTITPTATLANTPEEVPSITPSAANAQKTEAPKKTDVIKKTEAPQRTQSPQKYFAPEVGAFKKGDASYFDDALFIGDSRTAGIRDYGTLKNADYYAVVGLSVYNIRKRNAKMNGKDVSFETCIKQKQYKKVYITLGFNEVGYNKKQTVKRYKEIIDEVMSAQPEAIIFINANLLVTEKCSRTDKYSHNPDIIELNNMLAELADGEKIMYIDVNVLFGDGNGNMRNGLSGDGTHVYAKNYALWCEWLKERTV